MDSTAEAEKVVKQHAKACGALVNYFFIKSSRHRTKDGTMIRIEPRSVEKLFWDFLGAKLARYDYFLGDSIDILERMKDKKVQSALDKNVRPSETLRQGMLGYRETCEMQVIDSLMMTILASIVFSMYTEPSSISDARKTMRMKAPSVKQLYNKITKKLQSGKSAGEFFETIWARQVRRGVII